MKTHGFGSAAGAIALGAALVALSACSEPQDATRTTTHDRQAQALARSVHHARSALTLPSTTGVAAGAIASGVGVMVAAWPDRGELTASVPGGPVRRQGAYVWHPVRLSEAHAFASIATGELKLRAPNGELLTLEYDRHVEHPSGDWSWIGRVEGAPNDLDQAIITFGARAVFGEIAQATEHAPPLRIAMHAGEAWLGETTYAALQANASPATGPDYLIPPTSDRAPDPLPASAAAAGALPAALAIKPTVDILIGYTPGVVQYLGSTSAVVTRMNYHVDLTNAMFVRSRVNGRLRLVHTAVVNYPDTTDMYDALYDLTGVNGHEIPASLQPLHALRDQFGADLVSLVRQGGCGGVAWLNGGGQTPIDASDAAFGFSTVHEPGCADGLVVPHELGHNFGISHDLATDGGTRNGAYTYAHGYKTPQPDGVGFADVMAYTDAGQPKYHYYANPNLAFNGVPGGSATDGDGARTLNNTFPKLALFRPTRIFNGYLPRQDVSGDGRSDLLFFNPAASRWAHWRMNGATVVATPASRAYGSGNQLVASGDFNGDGRGDQIWMTPARKLYLWQSNGTTMASYPLQAPALSTQWRIVGAADITGNGKAKLLFVNETTRRFTFWSLNGTTPTYNTQYAINAGDHLVATGDFNADGQHDLAWKNASGFITVWWTNVHPLDSAKQPIRTAHGWVVLGAGDITGDGRADLMFFNHDTRKFTYWRMSGNGYMYDGPATSVGAGWVFSTSGDYNGDGRVDLVWRNGTTLGMWMSNGTLPGNASTLNQALNGSWRVVKGGVGGN